MNWPDFSSLDCFYVIVCFVHEADWQHHQSVLEDLGNQRNVKLIIQPCPYEAIEFLFRIDSDLLSHLASFEKDIFWKALKLKKDTPKEVIETLAGDYHAYFCAVLEQDEKRVLETAKAIKKQHKFFVDETMK